MVQILTTQEEIQAAIHETGKTSLAFIPTMGALHQGHLSLVELGKKYADYTCVSIFVNPTQFGIGEDFDKYPRTFEQDLELLKKHQVDFVFAPQEAEIYPKNQTTKTITAKPELANKLCGLDRPGHFDGVCTVVNILFNKVRPKFAIFGEKDYQQLKIIQEMVTRLKTPIKIIPGAIIREPNGLAMSSRNKHLSDAEKNLAGNIYTELCQIAAGNSTTDLSQTKLTTLGFEIDYLEEHWGRVFFAGKLGSTRLIDNVSLEKN